MAVQIVRQTALEGVREAARLQLAADNPALAAAATATVPTPRPSVQMVEVRGRIPRRQHAAIRLRHGRILPRATPLPRRRILTPRRVTAPGAEVFMVVVRTAIAEDLFRPRSPLRFAFGAGFFFCESLFLPLRLSSGLCTQL